MLSGGEMKLISRMIKATLAVFTILGLYGIWKITIDTMNYKQTAIFYQLEVATFVYAAACCFLVCVIVFYLKIETK